MPVLTMMLPLWRRLDKSITLIGRPVEELQLLPDQILGFLPKISTTQHRVRQACSTRWVKSTCQLLLREVQFLSHRLQGILRPSYHSIRATRRTVVSCWATSETMKADHG